MSKTTVIYNDKNEYETGEGFVHRQPSVELSIKSTLSKYKVPHIFMYVFFCVFGIPLLVYEEITNGLENYKRTNKMKEIMATWPDGDPPKFIDQKESDRQSLLKYIKIRQWNQFSFYY